MMQDLLVHITAWQQKIAQNGDNMSARLLCSITAKAANELDFAARQGIVGAQQGSRLYLMGHVMEHINTPRSYDGKILVHRLVPSGGATPFCSRISAFPGTLARVLGYLMLRTFLFIQV